MKNLFRLFSLVIVFVFASCTEEQNYLSLESEQSTRFDTLINYLKINFPDRVSTMNLESIKPLKYHNQNIGYQIFDKANPQIFLLLKKDDSTFSGNWVDFTALSKTQLNKYSGNIQLKSISGEKSTKLLIENNKVIQVEKWVQNLSRNMLVHPRKKTVYAKNEIAKMNGTNFQDVVVLSEVIIVVNDYYYWSLFWLFNEYSNYSYLYGGGDSTGGGGSNVYSGTSTPKDNVITVPVYDGPKDPIANLKNELKCLTVDPNSTYSISINVNQPRPNSRDKVDPSNNFMAGHTFLTLEQEKPNGAKVVRNIGFYPESTVYPGNFEDQSIFGEDSGTPFAVSLKIAVTGQDMNTVINSLTAQQSLSYNLENSNCVSSVISSLQKINIQLPMTSSGIEHLFKGVNPGDFGQDIRNLDLDNFRGKIGNRKVERKTSEKNDLQPNGKKGTC